jgi:signal transduction histidine kinase
MSRLFTAGGRGKNSLKVNVDSTGFGLFIAKQIVTDHKGRIWVESDGVGKGSTFTVELPKNTK